jgi:hypothetical protein
MQVKNYHATQRHQGVLKVRGDLLRRAKCLVNSRVQLTRDRAAEQTTA